MNNLKIPELSEKILKNRIPNDELELWTVDSYYDLPLSGSVKYRGKRCFYSIIEIEYPFHVWEVYELPENFLKTYIYNNLLFQKYVSTQWIYLDENGNKPGPQSWYNPNEEERKLFYNREDIPSYAIENEIKKDTAKFLGYMVEDFDYYYNPDDKKYYFKNSDGKWEEEFELVEEENENGQFK